MISCHSPFLLGEFQAKKDCIAGHQTSKSFEANVADGVGVAGDERKQNCLNHWFCSSNRRHRSQLKHMEVKPSS